MPNEKKSPTLQLSEGYRATRRMNSILCALALAWSAAQFDLKSLNIGFAGNVDLSRASIPLILFCAIVYTTARYSLEFAMQSVEIRRWRLAQADFKMSIFLVRVTIVFLSASGLNRSVETILYLVLGALGVFTVSGFALFLCMMGLMPLLSYMRIRQGRWSVASMASESLFWAELIVVCLLLIILVALGVASLHYEPLRSLWTLPPSPLALGFFVFVCVAVVASLYLQRVWYGKLFAIPPNFTEQRLPDGSIQRTYHNNPPDVWDWYSQPVNNEESKK